MCRLVRKNETKRKKEDKKREYMADATRKVALENRSFAFVKTETRIKSSDKHFREHKSSDLKQGSRKSLLRISLMACAYILRWSSLKDEDGSPSSRFILFFFLSDVSFLLRKIKNLTLIQETNEKYWSLGR